MRVCEKLVALLSFFYFPSCFPFDSVFFSLMFIFFSFETPSQKTQKTAAPTAPSSSSTPSARSPTSTTTSTTRRSIRRTRLKKEQPTAGSGSSLSSRPPSASANGASAQCHPGGGGGGGSSSSRPCGLASQEYYIRPRDGNADWDAGRAEQLVAMLEASIQRRFPRGLKVHVRTPTGLAASPLSRGCSAARRWRSPAPK